MISPIPEVGSKNRLLHFLEQNIRFFKLAVITTLTVMDLTIPESSTTVGVVSPVDFEQVGGLVIGETYIDPASASSWTLSIAPATASAWHPVLDNDGYASCKVAFVVPQSGKVRIRVQVTIDVANINTILFALCTSSNGTFLDNQYQKRVLLTGTAASSAADSVTHVEWIVDGLTPGTSTTYYLGAAVRSSSVPVYLKWGGSGGGPADTVTASYPAFIMQAIAVASNADIV